MSVVGIQELSFEETASDPDPKGEASYLVTVDSTLDRAVHVMLFRGSINGAFLPQIGFPHPAFGPNVVCTGRKFKWTDDDFRGILSATFERESGDSQKSPDRQQEENPLNEPPVVTWRSAKVEKPMTNDVDGAPILNIAGLPYLDPVTKRSSHLVLEVTRNEVRFDGTRAQGWIDRVNSAEFQGAAAGTLLLDIAADNFFSGGREYWKVSYTMEYDPDGWNPTVLETGLMKADGGAGVFWTRIKDTDGEDITEPVPLDANGLPIPRGSLPGAALFTTWKIYEQFDFADLGLPV